MVGEEEVNLKGLTSARGSYSNQGSVLLVKELTGGSVGHPRAKKMNVDTALTPCTEAYSKWIIHLNVKHKAIKLLEDNIGKSLDDLCFL